MFYRTLFAGACVLTLAVVQPSAQQPPADPAGGPPPQSPTFRGRIDAVSVDAIVTDKQGRPVTDLKAEDFEISENKKPQAIQSFKFIKVDDTAQVESSFIHDISSLDEQQRETARDDVRVVVIFLDDYHVRVGNSLAIKQELANFVSQLTSHDLVALMWPLSPVTGITFSRNHDVTASQIMSFVGRKFNYAPQNEYESRYADYPPEQLEILRRQIVVSALEGLAKYLGTLRDGKKQILYVSEGLTGTLPPGTVTTGQPFRTAVAPKTESQRFFDQADVLSEMQRIFVAAARGNTSIYTLDPRGLAVSEFQINDNVSQENDRLTLNEAQDSLRILASNTDGRAIVNRNQPIPELKKMLSDTSAYYLLGYTSTEAPRDGKFHEIQVRVKRKDVEVRARKGYWAYNAEDVARASAPVGEGPTAAVESALGGLVTSREHSVRVWVGSQRGSAGKASVTLAWEPSVPGGAPGCCAGGRGADTERVDHITLTATSVQGDVLFRGPVSRDPQATTPMGHISFAAPPGTVRLQISAEDARGQRLDHDDRSVVVPDFTDVGPMITTPVVFRARTVRDVQQIRASSSPLPAVSREFSRTERLLMRFEAYGPGGTVPKISMRLLNSLGKPMAALPDPVRLPDGVFESEVGLGPLAPGAYLIEINAESGSDKIQELLAIRITG